MLDTRFCAIRLSRADVQCFLEDLGLHLRVFLGALPGGLYDEVGGEDAYVNEQGDTALENV